MSSLSVCGIESQLNFDSNDFAKFGKNNKAYTFTFNKKSSLFEKFKDALINKIDIEQIRISNFPHKSRQNPVTGFIEHYRNVFASPDNYIKRRIDYSHMKVANEKYRKESERLESFMDFPKHLSHLVKPIAKSGFYFIGDEKVVDRVKCIFCQGTLHEWKKGDTPDRDHKKFFPTCPFLLNLNVGNEPLKEEFGKKSVEDPDLKDFNGVIPYNVIKPTSDEYLIDKLEMDVEWRENTFHEHNHLKYLSMNGLFVTNKNNKLFLECCKCRKQIDLLKGIENLPASIFHQSECCYKDCDEIDTISSRQIIDKKNFCQVEYSITNEEIEARLDLSQSKQMEKLNYDRDKMKSVISTKLKTTGYDYESIFELLVDMKNFNEKVTRPTFTNDLAFILADYSCVVCLDNPIEDVFIPCGHMKTCQRCSSQLKTCPVCRTFIVKRVRGIQVSRCDAI